MSIQIKEFQLGMYMTNCYLVWDENMQGYLFDCGGDRLDKVVEFVKNNDIEMKGVILTHGHYDHIGGVNSFISNFKDTSLYIGEEEKQFLTNSNLSLSKGIDGTDFRYTGEIKTVNEGDKIGNFRVISTPGHTIGSKCFFDEKEGVLFSGDTMFRRSFGRHDLATGDEKSLYASLKKLCDTLPESTVVYSGHTSTTTIGEEKEFLKQIGIIR